MSDTAKKPFDRANHCRQIGTLGGRKTAQTYGSKYMSEIGKIGFQALAENRYDGNRAKTAAALKAFTAPSPQPVSGTYLAEVRRRLG